MPSIEVKEGFRALGLSIAHEGWAEEKKRPRPGVRVQRDWKRPGLHAGAPPEGELWLRLRLRFLDDEGCFANGADNWVAAQVVKHVLAVFTKSLCSALFHNYEAISNRMNRWPLSYGERDAGALRMQSRRAIQTGAPTMPNVKRVRPMPGTWAEHSIQGSALCWPLFMGEGMRARRL